MKNKKSKIVFMIVLCVIAVAVLTGGIVSSVDKPEDDSCARYIDDSKDKILSKQIIYNGKTVDLKYKITENREPTNFFGKVSSKYGANDLYTDADGNEYGFLYNTDTLCLFFASHENIRPGSVVSSNDEAKIIADKYVFETLGFSKDKYVMSECGYNGAYYSATYTKYTAGVKTNDIIMMSVYTGGEVASWAAFNTGRCDDLSLTEEQIYKCRTALKKEISIKTSADKWSVYDEYIMTNAGGQAQLVICVTEMVALKDGSGYSAIGREYSKTIR